MKRQRGSLEPGLSPPHGNVPAAHYAAAKGGIIAFTRQVAREVAALGITVNAVAPGTTATPRVLRARTPEATREIAAAMPVGRLGTPEEIAEAILFLASDAARFITGATLDVNGGQAMLWPTAVHSRSGARDHAIPESPRRRPTRRRVCCK
jgi:NAD(P)-dependent dehydrogenase (short-subunit alcohol dehydrogenase family)